MTECLFADGIGEITVSAGVVRIELFLLSQDRSTPAKSGEPPKMQTARTIMVAMPLAGFVASLKTIDDIKQKLIDNGVLRSTPDQAKEPGGGPKTVTTN